MLQRRCCLLLGGGGGSRKERGGDSSGVRVSVCVRRWWAQVVVSSIMQRRAGRQAQPKQASQQQASKQASKQAKARQGMNGSRESNPLVGGTIAWYNRVCLCDEAAYVQLSATLCHSWILYRSLHRFLSQSLDLPALSYTPHSHSITPHTRRVRLSLDWRWRWAGSKAQARGSRLARPRSELCTRQTTNHNTNPVRLV